MICDRCYQPSDVGEHGHGVCPFEPRRDSRFPNVIADDVPGGFTVENMGREPERFYSKSAWRAAVAARGLRIRDESGAMPSAARARFKWGER